VRGPESVEIKVSLALLVLLGAAAHALTAADPRPTLEPGKAPPELAALEDQLAREPGNPEVARRLAAEYLRLDQPALALGVVRAVRPELVSDPLLTHRIAQAYEALGRLDDAAITASVARARCLRAVGSDHVGVTVEPTPLRCSPGALLALERHEHALLQMLRWGVSDPRNDSRAIAAHDLAARRARIASAE
jgi:hypothetical protein